MSARALWQVSITTSAEAEEAVAALLENIFYEPASVYFNEKTKRAVVSVYCPKKSGWNPAKHDRLLAGLRRIKAAGLNIGRAKISVKRLPRENWAESWKRHFKPIEIGSALLVKPSWSRRRARKGQAVVVLDPGLSFGTGQHATTGFCLRQLVAAVCDRRSGLRRSQTAATAKSFLDIGTGSGILAIAAAKLGYAPVHAFDFDREAVRVARENARQNHALKQLRLYRADLTKLPLRSARKFDFIAANLISTLLIAERRRIVNRLKPGGILVVAGILQGEFPQVQKYFERLGLKFLAGRCEKEWRSGTFAAKSF